MKRKVIQIAESTQLISLPRKWAQLHNIKKGDELDIEEGEDTLTISTDKGVKVEKINIDVSKFSDHLVRWGITALYKRGYDEVEVTFAKPDTMDVIKDAIQNTLGYEIIEHQENKCLIKNLSKGLESEFDSTFRRAFLVTLSMADSSLERVRKGEFEKLKEVIVLENTNNKLVNFCERMLNLVGYKDHKKTVFVYLIIWQLESIADDYRDLCKFLLKESDTKIDKEIIEMFEKANHMLKSFYEIFYELNQEKLVEIYEEKKKVFAQAQLVFKKTKDYRNVLVTNSLVSIATRINDLSGALLAMEY
jgi:phosphate uptake regulator